MGRSQVHFNSAIEDFHRARRQESINAILSRLIGKRDDLLSYDEIRKAFGATESSGRKLKDIPIKAIKGNVIRYTDFTSTFLPKRSIDAQRWAGVKATSASMIGIPPIDVYQVGEIFFVLDGNHRVSIARHAGNTHIQAYVKKVNTRIHLPEGFHPNDLIINTEYLEFLEATNIDRIFPQTKLVATSPGKFPVLQQQIEAIHFALEQKSKTNIPFKEAVIYWHNKIYMPIIEVLNERKLIEEFPARSETDLYIWIIQYQSKLITDYGWDISPETTAKTLMKKFGQRSAKFKIKARNIYHHWLYGPKIGKWREERISTRQGRLFTDILVVLNGSPNDQYAIDLSINIAKIEGAKLFGLYISTPNKRETDYRIGRYQKEFIKHCDDANVQGELAVTFATNPVTPILRRAEFANLVIFPLGTRRFQKVNYSTLIHKCPTPIITISEEISIPLKKSLLAFNGSPKSKEALFLGAYLSKFWEISLVVLSPSPSDKNSVVPLIDAFEYLKKYNIKADFIKFEGHAGIATTTFAIEDQCDIIIMGGYSSNSIKKKLSGSIVDEVLIKSKKPVLICK